MANVKELLINGVNIFDLIYPVGSVVILKDSTNPSELYGGTWTRVKGKTIVGVDEDDDSFKTSGLTGGEKTHKLTIEEMPSHNHPNSKSSAMNWGQNWVDGGSSWSSKSSPQNEWHQPLNISSQGGSQSHNNLPPYITYYVWERTA